MSDVDEFGDLPELGETGQIPASKGSAFERIRANRAAAKARLFKVLEIPRMEPKMWVRYQPIPTERIEYASKVAEKAAAGKAEKNAVLKANAAILAEACVEIFELDEYGEEISIDPDHGEPVRFDAHLAEILEMPHGTRRGSDIVLAMYLTEGDVVGTATTLAEWSGYADRVSEKDSSGN
ncbi:MAG: hypothetical protein F2667_00290 [Actinobacteria bacterium]|nr:hypothetical protein [Actinomycetota bacterium]